MQSPWGYLETDKLHVLFNATAHQQSRCGYVRRAHAMLPRHNLTGDDLEEQNNEE